MKRLRDLACGKSRVSGQVRAVVRERTVVVAGGDVLRIPVPRPPTDHTGGWCSTLLYRGAVLCESWHRTGQRQRREDKKPRKDCLENYGIVTTSRESLGNHGLPRYLWLSPYFLSARGLRSKSCAIQSWRADGAQWLKKGIYNAKGPTVWKHS